MINVVWNAAILNEYSWIIHLGNENSQENKIKFSKENVDPDKDK